MSTGLLAVLLASGLGALAHAAGILLVQKNHDWTQRNAINVTAFAGGVMVSTALVHLLPEATLHYAGGTGPALVTFFALYLLESHFVRHAHHHLPTGESEEDHHHVEAARDTLGFLPPSIGIMTVVGFTVHTIFDGLAIGAGFHQGFHLGGAATFAVLVHEFPEGIATYALVAASGFSKRTAMIVAWSIAAIDPVVAVVSYLLLENVVSEGLVGILLALVGGSFLYIGATDLLPEVGRRASLKSTAFLLLGVGIVVVARLFFHH